MNFFKYSEILYKLIHLKPTQRVVENVMKIIIIIVIKSLDDNLENIFGLHLTHCNFSETITII